MRISKYSNRYGKKLGKKIKSRRSKSVRFGIHGSVSRRYKPPKNGEGKPPRPQPIPPIITAHQPNDGEDTKLVE